MTYDQNRDDNSLHPAAVGSILSVFKRYGIRAPLFPRQVLGTRDPALIAQTLETLKNDGFLAHVPVRHHGPFSINAYILTAKGERELEKLRNLDSQTIEVEAMAGMLRTAFAANTPVKLDAPGMSRERAGLLIEDLLQQKLIQRTGSTNFEITSEGRNLARRLPV